MAAGGLVLPVCLSLLFLGRNAAAAAATEDAGAKYYPAGQCVTSCDADHKCLSDACEERWDDCSHGFDKVQGLDMVQMSKEVEFDENDCYDNGCSFGGCDKEATYVTVPGGGDICDQLRTGYAEFSKKSCSNIIDAFCVFCYQEKCCRLREWVKCCPKLDCVKELAGCPSVPLQEASHTWESSIFYTKLADGGSVVFPFYRVSEVPEGGDCESERSLGACSCADGKKMPGGCNAQDSSTWAVWNGTAASAESLPAGLSLTCAPKPPPPAAGPAGSEGQASAGVPSEAPGADGEGDGARGAGDADAAESGSEADTHSDETGPKKEGEGTAAEGAAASESEASESEQEGARGGPGAYTGTVVAASIVSAMTAAAIVTGIAVACKRRQRKKSHVRTSEAYEAMLTGTSYTPPIKAKAPLMSLVQRAFQRVIGRKQPDFQPSLDTLEDGSALQEPAAPADDEIFTVRDLAQNEGNQRAKKWHKRSVHTMGKEMEMQEQAHLLQQSLAKMSKPDITTYELPLQSREGSERVEEFVDGADEGERPRTPPPTGGGQRRGDPDTYHRD